MSRGSENRADHAPASLVGEFLSHHSSLKGLPTPLQPSVAARRAASPRRFRDPAAPSTGKRGKLPPPSSSDSIFDNNAEFA